MAKKRSYFDPTTWSRTDFVELDPTEKLIYCYLFLNEHVNYCGIYKLPVRNAAFESGIDKDTVIRILKRFADSNTIIITDEYIILTRFLSEQAYNELLKKVARKEFEELPETVLGSVFNNDIVFNNIKETIYKGSISSPYNSPKISNTDTTTPSCFNDGRIMASSCGTSISDSISLSINTEREPLSSKKHQYFEYEQIKHIVTDAGYPESVAERFYLLHEAVGWKVRGELIQDINSYLKAWLKNEKTPKEIKIDSIKDVDTKDVITALKTKFNTYSSAQSEVVISLFANLPQTLKQQVRKDLITACAKCSVEGEFYDFFRNYIVQLDLRKGA